MKKSIINFGIPLIISLVLVFLINKYIFFSKPSVIIIECILFFIFIFLFIFINKYIMEFINFNEKIFVDKPNHCFEDLIAGIEEYKNSQKKS